MTHKESGAPRAPRKPPAHNTAGCFPSSTRLSRTPSRPARAPPGGGRSSPWGHVPTTYVWACTCRQLRSGSADNLRVGAAGAEGRANHAACMCTVHCCMSQHTQGAQHRSHYVLYCRADCVRPRRQAKSVNENLTQPQNGGHASASASGKRGRSVQKGERVC